MDKKKVIELLKFYDGIDTEIQLKIEMYGESQAEQAVKNLKELKSVIRTGIDRLPHKEKSLIWYHYVKGQVWDKLSMKHWYSVRQLNNVVNKALATLGKYLDQEPSVQEFLRRKAADHTS